jgi:hypothetical protein
LEHDIRVAEMSQLRNRHIAGKDRLYRQECSARFWRSCVTSAIPRMTGIDLKPNLLCEYVARIACAMTLTAGQGAVCTTTTCHIVGSCNVAVTRAGQPVATGYAPHRFSWHLSTSRVAIVSCRWSYSRGCAGSPLELNCSHADVI